MAIIPQALLLLLVLSLFFFTIKECFKFEKGPVSIKKLKQHRRVLTAKSTNQLLIDPEQERKQMEILQNQTKTTCDQAVIMNDLDLKGLMAVHCSHITKMTENASASARTAWLKYSGLMHGFNEQYFPAAKALPLHKV